jgi:hypothetical protein
VGRSGRSNWLASSRECRPATRLPNDLASLTSDLKFELLPETVRCTRPFSQARTIEVTRTGQVSHKTGHNAVGRFPEPGGQERVPKRTDQPRGIDSELETRNRNDHH